MTQLQHCWRGCHLGITCVEGRSSSGQFDSSSPRIGAEPNIFGSSAGMCGIEHLDDAKVGKDVNSAKKVAGHRRFVMSMTQRFWD
jgi:hypothetical protein